jgi:hypothetical protein
MRFEVLTEVLMRVQMFWDVTSDYSRLQVSRFACRKLQPGYLNMSVINPSPNSEVSLLFDIPYIHRQLTVSIGSCCSHQ